MKTEWTPKNLSIAGAGIITLVFTVPKLGDGLDYLRKLLGTTEVAYAAKAQVEEVDEQFQEYLQAQKEAAIAQKASAEAINAYVGQQQQMQQQQYYRAPEVWTERDQDGTAYCTDGREVWWPTESGRCD